MSAYRSFLYCHLLHNSIFPHALMQLCNRKMASLPLCYPETYFSLIESSLIAHPLWFTQFTSTHINFSRRIALFRLRNFVLTDTSGISSVGMTLEHVYATHVSGDRCTPMKEIHPFTGIGLWIFRSRTKMVMLI